MILRRVEKSHSLHLKAIIQPKYPVIEEQVYDWMQIVRGAKLPVNSHALFAKALIIGDHLLQAEQDPVDKVVLEKFGATPSWIAGFAY